MKLLRPRYKKIEELVQHLLNKYGITAPPIPISEIAEAEGGNVRIVAFNNEISGLLLRTTNNSIIAIEASQAKTRQRFTIAHELGHLLLHAGKELRIDTDFRVNLRSVESSKAEDVEEVEANAFAGSLLVPETFLKTDIASLVLDIDDPQQVQELAKRYDVSAQAMTIRLMILLNLGRI